MPGPEAFDVAVVGGGTAGVAAALAASRWGARTVLVERSDVLGGNAATAQVHTICGLYLGAERPGAAPPEMAHPGFPREFAEALVQAGAAGPPTWAGRVAVLPTEPAGLAAHAERICAEAEGLTVWMRATLESAQLADVPAQASRLGIARDSGPAEVSAAIVVDASGDGAVAHLGGAEWTMAGPGELQAASYIFELAGLEPGSLAGLEPLKLTRAVARAVQTGRLSRGCGSVTVRESLRPGTCFVTLTVPKLDDRPFDPLDEDYRHRLEGAAVEASKELEAFFVETRPGFGDAHVSARPRRIGIRETRRMRGIVEVSAEDVLRGRRPDDEVALSTWPIELWRDHRRAHFQHPDGPCGIPLGALVSRSHGRLGMAGRCLSASHEALGALRVLGTALATGEAVGVAAGLAADAGTSLASVSPADVRRGILRLAGGGSGP